MQHINCFALLQSELEDSVLRSQGSGCSCHRWGKDYYYCDSAPWGVHWLLHFLRWQ